MKKVYFSMLAVAALLLGACSSNDELTPDEGDAAKNIDYTEANSASWRNYMRQVSALLCDDADALHNAWTVSYEDGTPFASQFKSHNNSEYPSVKSCLDQIVEGCADIANEVGTAKIGDPYNQYFVDKEKALYAVESWYSWHSRDDYTNNIYSIRNSYYGSLDGKESNNSIAALIKETNPTLDTEMRAAITAAANAIQAIPQPFRNNINSKESLAAMTACATLESLLTNKLKPALDGITGRDAQLQAIVDNYVDNVVVPTYADLATKNKQLQQSVLAFYNSPSDAAFRNACNAWMVAREPWEKSEAFLFGPVDALGLDPNMDSWPLDQVSIVNILNSGNYDDLNWEDGDDDDAIEAKQGVRGFHTLEFLLFKNGNPRTVK